jgi:CubicO group peptidase (beta-lactamase class C family)
MLGFDPAKLSQALAYNPDDLNTEALLVIRHGYIAAEQYFGSFTQSSRHQSYSMAKSFSSALLGIALEQGKIASVDEKLCKYYPEQLGLRRRQRQAQPDHHPPRHDPHHRSAVARGLAHQRRRGP